MGNKTKHVHRSAKSPVPYWEKRQQKQTTSVHLGNHVHCLLHSKYFCTFLKKSHTEIVQNSANGQKIYWKWNTTAKNIMEGVYENTKNFVSMEN